MSVPRVDPNRRRGPLGRLFLRFVRSRPGRWWGINVATRLDPWLLRVTGGRFSTPVVLPVAMLTARGARSGQPRTNPVLYFSDGEDVVLVASSFGRDRHPAWYHNLRANPEATLTVGRGGGRYRAHEAEGGERDRLWEAANRVYPGYDDYQRRASHRRIPVLVLSPID